MEFPNGISSYLETYFEIVSKITKAELDLINSSVVKETHEAKGIGGLYELAEDLATKFQTLYSDESFNELDYFDTIDAFLIEELKIVHL